MTGKMLPVALPGGFDPARDQARLEARVRELKGQQWSLASIDVEAGKAYFVTADMVTTIVERDGRKGAQLPADVRPGDGDRQATLLAEAFDLRYPGEGWVMTEFDPYLRQAIMERLDSDELRAREALATALGVKPWQVQVHKVDGGFDVHLPASYSASRHDLRINEAVTMAIGRPGWYFTINAQALTMQVRAGALPTFPDRALYPWGAPTNDTWSIPLGLALGSGGTPNRELAIGFDDVPGMLSTGTAGSGKSVGVNAIITGALLRGWELVVIDAPHKAVDFLWCKDFCRPGGWGCDSKEQALTALDLVYEHGQAIARLLKEHHAQKVADLPVHLRPAPVLIVIDEATALFMLEPVPKGIPKDHPLVIDALNKNLVTQTLIKRVATIPAEMRFAGLRVVISTQMAQAKTGFDGPLKANLSHRVLWGANPSESARGFALSNPRDVPRVPEWIRADETAARGTGVAEFEGRAPAVLKGYFATTEQLREHLLSAGVPRCSRPEPTAAQIAAHTPSLDDAVGTDDEVPSRLENEGGFGDPGGEVIELRGAARAAHEFAVSQARNHRRSSSSNTVQNLDL
ncbi:hypothetical protein [Actinomyces gaoshouyii]|uniref:hypothetical protein n=1 Tax=Actinomyces gaoshouyii TaxID=1960083 RepID=UPI0009BFDBAC|nr:hypothetical protein [Actinomyces gaoshouyii]ARD42482.1 hypothetical protein B6G06_09140 [Actinomyces gaoshouyii]